MITRLTNEEYWLIQDAACHFPDNNSLSAGIEQLRKENSGLDQVIKKRFEGEVELLVSFIIANSDIFYDVEVTEEKVTKVTYFKYFEQPVTKNDVSSHFRRHRSIFNILSKSEEYCEFLDCSITAVRQMESVDALRYDVVSQSQVSQDVLPLAEFDHQELQSDLLVGSANASSWTTSSL